MGEFALFFVFVMCAGLFGCTETVEELGLWDNATYTEDSELGDGARTLFVRVVAEDKSVILTIHTDAKTVGAAMAEHNLISGEQSAYGLYVKEVIGIIADYDKNQRYWSFNKNGEPLTSGVDSTEFTDGEQFELVYTK